MRQKIIENKENILIILIILLSFIVRIFNWPNIINDVNCDEAMLAINARSIAQTGKDMYGTSFPVYFESWITGGQSALPTYLVAICIKIFGYNLFAIRLPILLFSLISLFIVYLFSKKVFNKKVATIVLFLTAINPWHILQSQWNLDCNIFPHIIIIAIYLLYIGIVEEKKLSLYFSMVFFALSMYSYGVSIYFVPLFLLIIAIYLLIKKKLKLKEIILSILIYTIISIPIYLMYLINLFNLNTVNILGVTIQKFNYVNRTSDMLIFSNNILSQLILNVKALLKLILCQDDGLDWNRIVGFGTIYMQSLIFVIFAIIELLFAIKYKKEKKSTGIILLWLGISLILGIMINGTNINRLNIIWYPLIILTGYGIYVLCNVVKLKNVIRSLIIATYILSFILFARKFYNEFPNEVSSFSTFSNGLVRACEFIESINEKNINLSNRVYYTDKQYIFLRYSLTPNSKNDYIKREELLAYHYKKEKDINWFDTEKVNYETESFTTKKEINGRVYLILSSEKENVININNYQQYNFNKYSVLIEKNVKVEIQSEN